MADIQGLIQHLRSQAEPGSADASALAAQFGVEESLVRNAMQTLSRTAARPEARRKARTSSWLGQSLIWLHQNAALGIGACGVLILAMLLLSDSVPRAAKVGSLGIALVAVLIGLLVAALSRRARYGLLLGPVVFLAIGIESWIDGRGVIEPMFVVGVGLIGIMISTIGALAAMVGGMVWLKHRQRKEKAVTRQQMLDRLLQVRLALEYPRTAPNPSGWRTWLDGIRQRYWWWSIGFAIFMAGVQTMMFIVLKPTPDILSGEFGRSTTNLDQQKLMIASAFAVVGFAQFLLLVVIGYLGRHFWKGLIATLIYLGASMVPSLLGLNPTSMERLSSMPVGQVVSTYIVLFICAAIGVGAAAVEDYSLRARLRQENDPEALLAELLELEIALGGGLQESYVLVVDVAGSTAMKKDADPLVAEWTFRSYQELIARVGDEHAGRVESTAGDGAVLGFPSANQALAAAKAILAAMPEFNKSTNRLGTEFVLRIGLHCGEVRGDLNQVQFTRVIDVAAHVEASSPRNGIGMTGVFRDKLVPVPDLEKMAVAVDGFDVYVV